MKAAVLTTVYSSLDEIYFDKFLYSLQKQTNKDFILVILNDGFKSIGNYSNRTDINIDIINVTKELSFAEVREMGIRYCIDKGINYIVFADSDDYFSEERIENSLMYLDEGYDIVINNLDIVNSDGNIIYKDYFNELIGKSISYKDILDKNYFGLSNTAVKTEILKKVESFPADIKVVDWWMYSILIYCTSKVKFIEKSLTYYRQHNNNMVGVKKLITKEYIFMAIDVKQSNYKSLYNYFDKIDKSHAKVYKEKYEQLALIKNKISANDYDFNRYLEFIRNNRVKSNAWWADIVITIL